MGKSPVRTALQCATLLLALGIIWIFARTPLTVALAQTPLAFLFKAPQDIWLVLGLMTFGVFVVVWLNAPRAAHATGDSRFRSYFENAHEGMYRSSPEGKFLDANPALVNMLGYTETEDVLALNLSKDLYFDPADRDKLKQELKAKRAIEGLEVRWLKRNGDLLFVQIFARGFGKKLTGEPEYYEGMVLDVTKSKLAEQNLAASQQQFRALVEDSVIGIYIIQDNTFKYANPTLATMFGYRSDELTRGIAISALVTSDQRTKFIEEIKKVTDGIAITTRFMLHGLRKDGGRLSVQVHGAITQFAGRNAVIGTLLDISEHQKAAEALRTSKEEYQSVLSSLREVIFQTDQRGCFSYLNPAWTEITGFAPQESIGQAMDQFVHPWDRDEHARKFKPILENQALALRHESRFLCKDYGVKWIEIHVRAVQDRYGKTTGMAGTLDDITDRKLAEQALSESRERYRLLVDTMNDGLGIQDKEGQLIYVNNKLCEIWGANREYLIGRKTMDLLDDGGRRTLNIHLGERNARPGQASCELEWIRPNGSRVPTLTSPQRLFDTEGNETGSFIVVTDITHRKASERALRESEERYALAASGANDGLWDWDLRSNNLYLSSRWSAMLGYTEDQFGSHPDAWLKRIHPEDIKRLKDDMASHLNGQNTRLENEHRMLHADGKYRWMLVRGVAVRGSDGKPTRMAGSLTDITQRKETEHRLWREAFYDALTDLPNRALFGERLERSLTRATRNKEYLFAVMFLDLDRFKFVNDSLGHLIGDKLLIGIARRLEKCLRPGDTVARMGGDEFNILLDDIKDLTEATMVAERIQAELALPFDLDGHEVFTSTSIGITLSSTGYERIEDILRDADTALYRAKGKGKACHAVFDSTMHAQAVARLQLENDLRRALERQQMRIYYQPIVSTKTNRIVGFESLLRWEHPTRGLILPGEFVHIAEENGAITQIGEWALRESCRQARTWQTQFPTLRLLTMNVNLSSKQFGHNDLLGMINEVLMETRLPPSTLRLEITESIIMKHGDPAIVVLSELRKLGTTLCIDDFGTGYSSLSYLHRFPINILKIDRSFVTRMDIDPEKREIVRAIVSLAHNLDMEVTAEGVETQAQLDQLREMNAEFVQGYYLAKPLRAEAATRLLASKGNEPVQSWRAIKDDLEEPSEVELRSTA
jgi:diguanylate cyclase (GGDEF)-like protein/PAS domain S-box-containing protein